MLAGAGKLNRHDDLWVTGVALVGTLIGQVGGSAASFLPTLQVAVPLQNKSCFTGPHSLQLKLDPGGDEIAGCCFWTFSALRSSTRTEAEAGVRLFWPAGVLRPVRRLPGPQEDLPRHAHHHDRRNYRAVHRRVAH